MTTANIIIITLVLIGGGYFIKEYLMQKGKNTALQEDNKKLTEENEQIKATYQLEITRRKYQYEAKFEVYKSFFEILDTINKETIDYVTTEVRALIPRFQREYTNAILTGNQEAIKTALSQYMEEFLKITKKYQEGLARLKQETHSIKLLASDIVLEKIKKLEVLFESQTELTNQVMKTMISPEYSENNKILEPLSLKEQNLANDVNTIKEEIVALMKKELNEI